MKTFALTTLILLAVASSGFGQAMGNHRVTKSMGNHRGGVKVGKLNPVKGASSSYQEYGSAATALRQLVQAPQPQFNDQFHFNMKTLYNVTPTSYMAVFHLFQIDKTVQAANGKIQARTDSVKADLEALGFDPADIYLDIISFLPIYELEKEHKVFSKQNYMEVPAGFEIKKNLHVRYTDKNMLDVIVASCARHEIFDFVKVEVFVDDLDKVKQDLRAKTIQLLKNNVDFQTTLGVELNNVEIRTSESFQVIEPDDMYLGYESESTIDMSMLRRRDEVKKYRKNTTIFYEPLSYTDFDLVVNPKIMEPVVQVVLNVKATYRKKPEVKPVVPEPKVIKEVELKKEVFIIDQNGQLKRIDL